MTDDAADVRFRQTVRRSVKHFQLDLRGLTVLTEAASGYFACTPLAAALGGAFRVIAVGRDSRFGTFKEVGDGIMDHARALGVEKQIILRNKILPEDIRSADIVTNLGFMRPIDAAFMAMMKPTAVIPLMYESWEFRPSDLDAGAAKKAGIPVMGTDEGPKGADTFKYCGALTLKLLFEAGIEVHGTRIAVISRDKFGKEAIRALREAGASTVLLKELGSASARRALESRDAIVLASLDANVLLGKDGQLKWSELARLSPGITVVQICGVARCGEPHPGVTCVPDTELEPVRMYRTLAYLGPRPVVDLNVAGLKVGEVLARARLAGKSPAAAKRDALKKAPAMKF
jgi:hypothetical protein